jgi:hypothetical protein
MAPENCAQLSSWLWQAPFGALWASKSACATRLIKRGSSWKDEGEAASPNGDPEDESPKQGAEADMLESLSIQAGTDQEKSHGEADFAEAIQCAECRVESREQRVEPRGNDEQENEPGPVDAGF